MFLKEKAELSVWIKDIHPKFIKILTEPRHDKTNKMACAPSEVSGQPGHPPSLIRVFAVRTKKPWVLLPNERIAKTDQTGRMPRLIWVFAGRTLILLVLSCCSSTNKPGSREVPQTENVSFQSIAAKTCFASVTWNFDLVENDLRVTI